MNAPNEFINVTVLAKAVAEQLRTTFGPNAPLTRVFHAEEAAIFYSPRIAWILQSVAATSGGR